MSTSHKIVLSLVATICITLIVFYSIKGNQEQATRRSPSPTTAKATPSSPAPGTLRSADVPSAGRVVESPVIVGRGESNQPTGIDDLVAKVRSELATSEPAAAKPTTTHPEGVAASTPSANGSASTVAVVPASTDVAEPTPLAATLPAPLTTSETTTSIDPAAAPDSIASASSAPAQTATAIPAVPSANAVAEVPTFTLGEKRTPEPAPGGGNDGGDASGNSSNGSSAEDRGRELFDVNLRDLAEARKERTSAPLLARVNSSEAPDDTKVATTDGAAGIVVDPHKPAVKVDAPAPPEARAKTETPAASPSLATADLKPSPNSPAVAPRTAEARTTPAAPLTPPGKTYTIKPGDSFSSIATRLFGAEKHWIDIADANPTVDPKRIRVGQIINLPDLDVSQPSSATTIAAPSATVAAKPEPAKPAAASPAPATSSEEARIHEVKPGENLSNISRRYFNTSDHWRHIYLTNRQLIGGDPSKLQAGTKLRITTPPKND